MSLFICGCDSEDPRIKSYHSHLVLQDGEEILTFRWWDKAGYEVCPIHGKRFMGWASTHRLDPPVDYKPETNTKRGLGHPDTPDLRDNRDPTEVGIAILAERNGIE